MIFMENMLFGHLVKQCNSQNAMIYFSWYGNTEKRVIISCRDDLM